MVDKFSLFKLSLEDVDFITARYFLNLEIFRLWTVPLRRIV